MRDLISIIQNLSEGANLSAGELTKYDWRFKLFLRKVWNGEPFTTVDGKEITIDPKEGDGLYIMYDDGRFKGNIKVKTIDGQYIPLSQLAKTGEFGGAAVAIGQQPSEGGKEGLLVKPSQIGITDKNIPASDLYETIKNNQVLNSTDYGKAVIDCADYIVAGEYVMLPDEIQKKDKVRKAIVDYAGEYLGVLALLYKRSRFPRKAQFEEWLGSSIDDLVINFPSKANTNLADSFATITNPNTSHTLNISSKGTGGGAAPAISGLKVPDYMRQNPAFSDSIKFIDICQQQGTIQQAFSAMDLIYEVNPKAINKVWHQYLPFATQNPKLPELAKASIDSKKSKQPIGLPKKYSKLTNLVSGSGTEGGKLVYAIKKEVADAINTKNGLPDFAGAILQILEMNFIQQYCDYESGQLKFATQWPAKLDGNISVENKSSSTEPTAGGFSFKLGRTDSDVSSEPDIPDVLGEPDTPDTTGSKNFNKAAQNIVRENNVGRKKRFHMS